MTPTQLLNKWRQMLKNRISISLPYGEDAGANYQLRKCIEDLEKVLKSIK